MSQAAVDSIVAAIDYSPVMVGIAAIAILLAGLYAGIKGTGIILGFLRR